VHELLDLALQQRRDRDAGPARDDLGDVLLVDLLLEQACALALLELFSGSARELALLELRDLAVAQLGRAVRGRPRALARSLRALAPARSAP
jgi:hypothetical protein